MRLIVQRSSGTTVHIDGRPHSQCGAGLMVLFGTRQGDTETSCRWLADKLVNLRIFEDEKGLMNKSALDVGAEIMIVSQFTLYADCRKGRRPSFNQALEPSEAEKLYNHFVNQVVASGLTTVTGSFGAHMDIAFTNHGPVTIILDHDV